MSNISEVLVGIRPILESAYFIASVVLALVAVVGLKQLKLMKTDMQIRAERAAKEKALECCHEYLVVWTEVTDRFHDDFVKKGLKSYEGPIGDFTSMSVPEEWKTNMVGRMQLYTWVLSLNKLESIAAMFVTGVADEITGFKTIGPNYCLAVSLNYDVISCFRTLEDLTDWNSIIELYTLWAPRVTRAQLESESRRLELEYINKTIDIEKQTSELPPERRIQPIGLGQ